MDVVAQPRAWAEENFGTAVLGDRRRTRRLVESAARIAAHPGKSFPQVFDWNKLRGFYRLCDQADVTHEAVMRVHWEQTRQSMAQRPLVLILHDTSELDFTRHPALAGTGPIGNGGGRGFLQHNSLAISPHPRQVLGLAYQQITVRKAVARQSSFQRKKGPRESGLWLKGIAASGTAPEKCCWVDVGDRGADIYEAMLEARRYQHHFLFRATQNRVVFLSADQAQPAHLLDHARWLPSRGSDQVEIPGRGGRPSRTATVALAGGVVWIPAPSSVRKRKSQPLLQAWVIRIWEPSPPEGVTEPLEWILVCSLPTEGFEELKERRDWYACRWMIEVYHNIEKSGCLEEDRRFETAERMKVCLAVLAVVAVRVFQLRCALEHQPNESAEQVATAAEIEVVAQFTQQDGAGLTVRDFVRGVAKLGGFLGRKGDGEPGVRTIWRGYQRLQDMLVGYLLNHPPPRSRSP